MPSSTARLVQHRQSARQGPGQTGHCCCSEGRRSGSSTRRGLGRRLQLNVHFEADDRLVAAKPPADSSRSLSQLHIRGQIIPSDVPEDGALAIRSRKAGNQCSIREPPNSIAE